eukprot:GEMP01034952.1.p1 GENE.GEMP01034952.1~~GEMP01034952.1.p1  ORF type:complete len:499 (+),score=112.68 GEMP01034952.1:103-1599(+)
MARWLTPFVDRHLTSTPFVRRFSFTGTGLKQRMNKKKPLFPEGIPEDVDAFFIDRLDTVYNNPAAVLGIVKRYRYVEGPSVDFLVRAFEELAWSTDVTTSFFGTADRQMLKNTIPFRLLMRDLLDQKENLGPAWAPQILFGAASLEYRFWQLLPTILDHVETELPRWSLGALLSMLHSLGALNIGGQIGSSQFGPENDLSRDYSHLAQALLEQTDRFLPMSEVSKEEGALLAAGCFGLLQLGLEEHHLFPRLLEHAAKAYSAKLDLDSSGLTRFHLYQILYCCDVLHPQNEEEIKRALPMWMQERLHDTWLPANVLLTAQPQGADQFQLDVEAALKRTKTQCMLNTSTGREEDEQHCFFAGHLIAPNIAFEYDSLQPLGPDRPKVNGWLALKQRIFPHFGLQTVAFHKIFWSRLTEDEQDEQILRVRAQAGYQADPNPPIPMRQSAFGYKGVEYRGRYKDKRKLAMRERDARLKAEKTATVREKEWNAVQNAREAPPE